MQRVYGYGKVLTQVIDQNNVKCEDLGVTKIIPCCPVTNAFNTIVFLTQRCQLHLLNLKTKRCNLLAHCSLSLSLVTLMTDGTLQFKHGHACSSCGYEPFRLLYGNEQQRTVWYVQRRCRPSWQWHHQSTTVVKVTAPLREQHYPLDYWLVLLLAGDVSTWVGYDPNRRRTINASSGSLFSWIALLL